MVIHIWGRLGETRISPDRAEVDIGEPVGWLIEVDGGPRSRRELVVSRVAWQIYFEGPSPFRERSYDVTTEVDRDAQQLVHRVMIDAGEGAEPGDYKYGVRAVNAQTRQALSDDDPYIVVRPRSRQRR